MDKTSRSCCSRTFSVLVCHFDHISDEMGGEKKCTHGSSARGSCRYFYPHHLHCLQGHLMMDRRAVRRAALSQRKTDVSLRFSVAAKTEAPRRVVSKKKRRRTRKERGQRRGFLAAGLHSALSSAKHRSDSHSCLVRKKTKGKQPLCIANCLNSCK